MRYWINTVSLSHVKIGLDGGFMQANHGKRISLAKLTRDDIVVFYSPKTDLHGTEKLQVFTAVTQITDEEPYQFEMSPDFIPWRRSMKVLDRTQTSILPLISSLNFIKDEKHWGFPFMRGLFEISEEDYRTIRAAMDAQA